MKLITISFDEAVDISVFLPGAEVELKYEEVARIGKVLSATIMEDTPALEGNYHIAPIE